jgi:hypothetical protein
MKARLADPENTSIARARHGKHVCAVTNNHATTDELFKAVFSMRSVPRLYEENQREFLVSREYELVAVGCRPLVAVGRLRPAGVWARKRWSLQCWGHNRATPSEDYNKLRILVCYRNLYSVITSYNRPVNPITNPDPLSGHQYVTIFWNYYTAQTLLTISLLYNLSLTGCLSSAY